MGYSLKIIALIAKFNSLKGLKNGGVQHHKYVLWYTTHMQKTKPVESISKELQLDLSQAGLSYRADQVTRLLYSTDASIYQVMPLGVVWPRESSEVSAVVEIAQKHGVPVLPRGGGSSLAGQAIGEALILDFSRYMDQVLELNHEEKTVITQPGVVLGSLNRHLAAHQLTFGPDPASADRATIGGVLGNNATGAHSILYGMAHDHLLEAETVLSDGTQAILKEHKNGSLPAILQQNSLEASIYRGLPEILNSYREEINTRYP